MRYNVPIRTLSLLLTIALLFQLFGVSTHAATEEVATGGDLIVGEEIAAPVPDETVPDESPLDAPAQVVEDLRPESAADSGSAYVVNEVTALRSETGKHFRLSDGTFIAVSYGQPVHYQDENGAWQDIDNTLTTVSGVPLGTETANTSVQLYEAAYGDQVRQFAASWQPGAPLFVMESGAFGVSMSARVSENETNSISSENLNLNTDLTEETPVSIQAAVESVAVDLASLTETERREVPLAQQVTPAASGALVTYEDVWPGVDLVYQAEGYAVKESIVIAAPQESYTYDFALNLTGLTPALCEDGTIALSTDSGEVVYRIPAPFMEDANGSYSGDVAYTLIQSEGDWLLTVTADEQWLNDPGREYPVVIDPSVYLEGNGTNRNIITAYVNSNYPTSRPGDVTENIRVGYCPSSMDASTYGTSIGLVYIKNLPSVPEGCVVTSSTLNLYQTNYYGMTWLKAFGSVMNSGYTAESFMDSVTWNTLTTGLTYGGSTTKASRTALDFEPLIASEAYTYNECFWDITGLVQDWYTDTTDLSSRILVLEAADGANAWSGGNPHDGRATYSGYTGGHYPQIIVHYQHTAGVESIYSYHTQSMGRAGTGYVNDFTLGLTVANTILASNSEVTPFALSLYYNSIAGDQQWTASDSIHSEDYSTSMTGAGWKTSVQQSVVQETLTGDNSTTDTYLIYMDADGTEHYFWKSGSTYYDEDGLGLTITVSGSVYTMTDKGNNTWEFYNGYLTKQTDSHGNMLLYGYDGVAITSATATTWKPQNSTAAHRVTSVYRQNASMTTPSLIATLSYTSDGYLSSVTDHNGYVTELSYEWTGGPILLESITFPDGQTASYTYDGGSRLTTAYDNEAKCGIRYAYANMQGQQRVSQITMYEGTGNTDSTTMLAQKINGTYTRFQYTGPDNAIGNEDDIAEYYTFDNWGRAINLVTLDSSEEDIYGVSVGTYTQNSGTERDNNRMTGAASSGIQGVNLLKNSGLELGASASWDKGTAGSMAIATDTNTPNPLTVSPRTGNYLLKLYLETGTTANCYAYQTIYLKAGQTYVFSGYVNTACANNFLENSGAYLSVQNYAGEEQAVSRIINYRTNTDIESGWERLEVVYTPDVSGAYHLAANWKNSSKVVAYDDFQIERVVETNGETAADTGAATAVNLLQMGGFQFVGTDNSVTTSGYDTYWGEEGDTSSFSLTTDTIRDGYVLKLAVYPSTKFRYSQTVNINASSNSTYILSGWGKATSAANNGLPMTGNNDSEAPFFGFIVKIVYADTSLDPEYQYVSFNHDCTDWQYVTGVIVPEEKDQTVSTMTVSLAYDYNLNYALFDDVSLVQEPVQTYSYDDEGNMLTASDSENAQTNAEYDSDNRLTGYTTMSGVSYTLTYSGDSRDPATITSDGVRTSYTYTANGQVSSVQTASTSGGKVLKSTYGFDANGDFTTSARDVNGNLTSQSYDAVTRQVARTTDAAGNQVNYIYTATNRRPEQIYQSGIAALWFGYENGSQTTVDRKTYSGTTAQWQRYETEINNWGLPTAIRVSSGADGEVWSDGITLTENTYENGYGNLIKKTMANGQYVEYYYDSLDRLVKTVYYSSTGAVQTSHVYVYNTQGQLAKQYVQDPSGTIVEAYTYEYDSLGRIIQSRAEDVNGDTIQRIQQLYDNANRLSAQHWEIQGDSYSESYTYDADDGSLQSMTTAGGQTLSYTYDFLKRHSATTVKNGSSTIFTVAKSYYNQTTDTTLTTAQVQYYNVRNSAGTLIAGSQYVYDARGNITQIKESESPYRVLYAYEYDSLNQLTKETVYTYSGTSTVASSTTVNTFTYDTAGNLLTVSENGVVKDEYTYGNSDWVDLMTKFNGTAISYDASGNPLNWYNGNTYTDLSWVMGRQLESMTVETDSEELDISYSYDMSGIRSSKTVVIGEVEAHTHEYTSVVTAPSCTTAGYTTYTCDCGESYVDNLVDALGHNYVQSGNVYTCSRCGDSYTGHEHSYTEATTEPTCLTAGYTVYTCSCGDSYTVDLPAPGHDYVLVNQSGNIGTYQCSRCGHTYSATIPVTPPTDEYSLRSSSPAEHHEYIYASGRLMREVITTTANGTSTTEVLDFVYGSGSAPLSLVYTNGTASPVTYYYVTNMQGDVVKLVTSSGTVVAQYAYDAWGKVISATGSMAEVNPIRYRGYYYDAETELYYLQSRYYDPAVKRFISADVVTSTGYGFTGNNMFAYCNDNPVLYSDTSGYVIELSEDATDEQIQQYERAIEYLKQSERGRELIKKLEDAEEVITIVFVDNDEMKYEPSNRTIHFDINSGLIMSDGGSIQSAAIGLAHEMGHAAQHLDGVLQEISRLGLAEEAETFVIETNCLTNYETPIAEELGEPTRSEYGVYDTMTMNNSTHFRVMITTSGIVAFFRELFGLSKVKILERNID